MALRIGEAIGPYHIVEQIGQGGMATVYKAHHEALDRDVAIKVMHQSMLDDPSFSLNVFQSARGSGFRLDAPNDSQSVPLLQITHARYFITQGQFETAEALLADIETNFGAVLEALLVRGELYAAQGAEAEAQTAWQAAVNAPGAPQWVVNRATDYLTDPNP